MKDRLKNNLGLKILALIFAIFLWWTVVNIDDPIDIKQYKVEVSIINTEIITNAGKSYQIEDDTKKVTVTVKARRKILSKIKASNIVAVADMREMQDNSVPIRVSIDGYEGEYEEVTAYPRNIQVSVENTLKKTFAITPIATGSPRAGHVVGRDVPAVGHELPVQLAGVRPAPCDARSSRNSSSARRWRSSQARRAPPPRHTRRVPRNHRPSP